MRRKRGKINWEDAKDIQKRINFLIKKVPIDWVTPKNIYAFRSINANTRAYARIWGLGRIWQQALDLEPSYVIEVISEKFDHLSQDQKDEILLHEIAHIPKNFSGSLMPHKRRGKGNFHDKLKQMITQYKKSI